MAVLEVAIDGRPAQRGAQVVIRSLDQIKQAANSTDQGLRRMDRATRNAGLGFILFSRLLPLYLVIQFSKALIHAADTMTLMENRIRLVTRSSQNLAEVQEALFNLAQETRSSYEGTVNLFTRVARSVQGYGKSQNELLQVTKAVNQAIQISGATAIEAQAGVIQFAQGLASGTLRGDELRSVLEQMPRLAIAIAQGLTEANLELGLTGESAKVTLGELRQLGFEGKLSTEALLDALRRQAPKLQQEFDSLESTIGQAFTQLGNSLIKFVGWADDATDASGKFIEKLTQIREFVDLFPSIIQGTTPGNTARAQEIEVATLALQKYRETLEGALRLAEEPLGGSAFERLTRGLLRGSRLAAGGDVEERQRLALLGSDDLKARLQGVNLTLAALNRAYVAAMGEATDSTLNVADAVEKVDMRLNTIDWSKLRISDSGVINDLEEFDGRLGEIIIEKLPNGLLRVREEFEETTNHWMDFLEAATDQAARNMQTAFADFFFDPFEDGLEGLVRNFTNAIRRMFAEAAAAKLMETLLGGAEGKSSWLGNILGSVLGVKSGGASTGAAVGGAATGAQFTVPGSGGRDSKLAAFRVTPGETVTVTPRDKGKMGESSITVINNNDFRGASPEVIATLKAQQEALARQTEARILERIRNRRV